MSYYDFNKLNNKPILLKDFINKVLLKTKYKVNKRQNMPSPRTKKNLKQKFILIDKPVVFDGEINAL